MKKTIVCFMLLLLAVVGRGQIELKNSGFTKDLVSWRNALPEYGSAERTEDGGVKLTVLKPQNFHGSFEQMIKNPPADTKMTLTAKVEGTKDNMAYLQVKLYKDGKELTRFTSPNNSVQSKELKLKFNTGAADAISVHFRTVLSPETVGQSATFRELELSEDAPPAPATLQPIAGISLKNANFEEFKSGATFPAGWVDYMKCTEVTADKTGGIMVKIIKDNKSHSSLEQTLKNPPADTKVKFSARVSGSLAGIAYLQIKLQKDGKEIGRFNSKTNTGSGGVLSVEADTKDADVISFHCRMIPEPANIGETATFKDLEAGETPPAPPKPPQARLETVPGFENCSIYLNQPNSEETSEFFSQVTFRKLPDGVWQEALPLVINPGESQARSSLLNLKENTRYELKLQLKNEGLTTTFSTLFHQVPIAKTIVLDAENYHGRLTIRDSGKADGYIRYTAAPGFVLQSRANEAVLIDDAEYIILENLTIRGGRIHGISVLNSRNIQILNCDVAGFGTPGVQNIEDDGKFFENGRALNNHAGINLRGNQNVLIERNYIHDPNGRANSWFYSHPAGPNAVFAGETAGATMRYNDFVGSDDHRWNDASEGADNGYPTGSFYRDAEIYGNYFAFGNDDGIELDGGQMNVRFYRNKIEGMLCGTSTAPCLLGPVYLFENLIVNPGEEFRFTNTAVKNNYGAFGLGKIHLFNNILTGNQSGFSGYANRLPERFNATKTISRNNLFLVSKEFIASEVFKVKNDFDFDLFFNSAPKLAVFDEQKQELNRILADPQFVNAEAGDYRMKHPIPGAKVANVSNQMGSKLILPVRPLAFEADQNELRFDSSGKGLSKTVTVTVTDPNFKGTFHIVQNESTRYFKVTPEHGYLEFGRPVVLKVEVTPEEIRQARLNSGAFLIRTPEGLSRPVAVYVDSSNDQTLLAADRKWVIYGKVSPQNADGSTTFTFDLPGKGKYYLFGQLKNPPWAVNLSYQDKIDVRTVLHKAGGGALQWCNLGGLTYGGEPNHPITFEAGINTVTVKQRSTFDFKFEQCALAKSPEELLLAPFADVKEKSGAIKMTPTIYLAGDSTVADYPPQSYPMAGWGQLLPKFCRPGVEVKNLAAGGRSTKSFRDEGRWERLIKALKPGDYVLIQFGHNDQKKEKPELSAPAETDYQTNLKQYIAEVRAKGAIPILCTSVNRRSFKKDGTFYNSLVFYPEAARIVAEETQTPLIDLHDFTAELYQKYGDQKSSELFTFAAPGEFPGYPEGIFDNSHFNLTGAELIAQEIVNRTKKQNLPIAEVWK